MTLMISAKRQSCLLYGECDDGEIGRVPCDDRFKIFLNSEHVIKGDEV